MIKDTKLIALLNSRERHDEYIKYIRGFRLTKECAGIIDDISEWYTQNPKEDSFEWSDLRNFIHIDQHPTAKPTWHDIVDAILDTTEKETLDVGVVSRLNELKLSEDIQECIKTIESKSNTDGVDKIFSLMERHQSTLVPKEDYFVDMDVSKLVDEVIKGPGISWRLDDLNLTVGQVHEGDFILVGKRPECGGTSFLTSEFTYMLNQLPEGKNAIIFNNEEGGNKIGLRVIQSALGVDSTAIEADPASVETAYNKYLNDRKIYIYDQPGMSVQDIERVLRANPDCWLIGLNVLDKIGGYKNMDEIARYRKLAEFSRRTAKEHGAVVAIAQADASAEGQQYLDQTQLYGSKTGVQGEADVMIMIGKDPDLPYSRFFSIPKNKKPTTGRMHKNARHGKFEAKFDEDLGRFTSVGSIK